MDTAAIALRNVTTGYGTKIVTENICANLEYGKLTCLLGPNGAGKSTLMKTLSGFITPIGGDIEINGKNASMMSAKERARTIGVVLTDRLSVADMTVRELVGLGRTPYTGFFGSLSSTDRHIVEESIAMVGIENLSDHNVQRLSDGERQKAMIAKALAQQTPIIFLDEPTAFLDYPSKIEIMRLLIDLSRNKNNAVFMSTHDLDLAVQLADYIWLLEKEKPLQIGIPKPHTAQGPLTASSIIGHPTFASILSPLISWH